jgi:signal transduction histidine kinase
MNRLQKIDLLDDQGRPWNLAALPAIIARQKTHDENLRSHRETISYAWGKRWQLPTEKAEAQTAEPPPAVKSKEFWKGSAFGVAVSARSFPGIIAVHANADYIFNFEKAIGVQSQIEDLGRQSDSEFVSFLDSDLTVIAHTDRGRIGQQEKEPLVLKAKVDRQLFSQVVARAGTRPYLEVVQPVALEDSNLGYLKIGLSLGSMEMAWSNSLRAIFILSLAIVAAGILGMAAIFHNQSNHALEVKALEARALQQERLSAMGNMAATVAHEIRNPLNAISIGLQRLKLEFWPADGHDDYTQLTEVMLGETHRLNSIVEQFLSLSRPIEIHAEAMPLAHVLNELVALEAGTARRSNVQIQVIAASNLPPLHADPGHLTQVLLNLILNALQAMPEGGTLTLEAKVVKDTFLITVTDTGSGIALGNRQRVFDPYFTTKTKGTGLGLAISRRIIEAHGGTLICANPAAGGCRFAIALPLNPKEA